LSRLVLKQKAPANHLDYEPVDYEPRQLSDEQLRAGKVGFSKRQHDAFKLLHGPQRHTCGVGGSRAGKTVLFTWGTVARALKAKESRHAILRLNANAVWPSIGLETFPSVMQRYFPRIKYSPNLRWGYFELECNGSQIWLGGLDDKERVDKILGREYATIYFNECSQIPYASVEIALSRLAQNIPGLLQRAYYDLNPVGKGHWTNVLFGDKLDPKTRKPLADPEEYLRFFLNPRDNQANLTAEYLKSLANATGKTRARFYEGIYTDETESALWSYELIDRGRLDPERDRLPQMQRIVVAIDPSGAKSGDERLGNDMIGIVVVGLGVDGHAYVLEDVSRLDGPVGWAKAAVAAFHRWNADRIIAEVNYGGAMVEALIRTVEEKVPFKAITASRGKVVRAEPCASLYGDPKASPTDPAFKGKVHHVGRFDALENQMTEFTDYGFMGEGSPDRVDALVWALTELMLAPSARPYLDFLEEDVARNQGKQLPHKLGLPKAGARKNMFASKPHQNFAPTKEARYVSAEDRSLHEVTLAGMLEGVQPEHVEALRLQGCTDAEI
jgi:hypothetical protein